jgi:hypothetical protein
VAELSLANALLGCGQAHLFEKWAEPGTDDAEKHVFFDQLASLDAAYPGGLSAYVVTARRLLAASAKGDNPLQGWTPALPPADAGTSLDPTSAESFAMEARGLEEAVKMARADFEKRMLKGDIQPGHTNPDLVSYNEIVTLTPEEVADVRSAIEEAIRPSDEGDRHRHTLPLNVRRSVQRLFPVRRGETNRVYRREVDVLLEWYHGLPRQNPRARLVRRTPKRKVSR